VDLINVIHVIIVDDHPVFRGGLRALLSAVPGMEVVGEAQDAESAMAMVEQLQPDVVIMDLQLPTISGIEATRRIQETSPHIGILVVTMFEDDYTVFAAMRAGARGYVLKDANEDDILRAIQAIARGEAIFSPAIARRVMDYFAAGPSSEIRAVPKRSFPELTERERELLNLIARGASNTQIAETLVLSPKTVRNHISSIFSKLQVAGRAEAIIKALEAGLG
jgi:DNA-binding NarL/FixJ family response regulator